MCNVHYVHVHVQILLMHVIRYRADERIRGFNVLVTSPSSLVPRSTLHRIEVGSATEGLGLGADRAIYVVEEGRWGVVGREDWRMKGKGGEGEVGDGCGMGTKLL